MQLIEQLDAELGIEKFRTELESSRVLVKPILAGGIAQHMHESKPLTPPAV
jgi:hypothetical protein